MNKTKFIVALISLFLLSSVQVTNAQRRGKKRVKAVAVIAKVEPPKIDFDVGMSKPWTHLFEVEMKVDWAAMPEELEVKMPVWTPGSYLIREYSRHVQDFEAVNNSGNPVEWQKTSKNTWQIKTNGSKYIRVKYKVYSNELTVRTNELNDEHGFFTPAALLMFPKGQIAASSTVKVAPYGDWKVGTGLKAVAGKENTFVAENFDILYDSPFEISNYEEKEFMVLGKKHRFIVDGKGNYDLDKIVEDTAKIIEESEKIFGSLPYEEYTFILNLRGGGGLEHLNSTALQWNRFGFQPESSHNRFLSLVAHEFFHLWNVKRIRPEPLGPFNYEEENYTKGLWVAEGLTSYYEGILLMRAGIIDSNEVLASEAGIIGSLAARPGRHQMSAEEASFDAWIKYYRQDENSINTQISYYSKGELLNFLLDIKIRAGSMGAKSMDDVVRYLNTEYFEKGKWYTPADYQAACEMMAGGSLDEFFSRYVRGRDDIDYDSILGEMGLMLSTMSPENDRGYFGANISPSGNAINVRNVPSDSPAYEFGINAGDQIIALDGIQTDIRLFNSLVGAKKAGEVIRVSFFRHGNLRELPVTLGKTPARGYVISKVDEPTAEQQALYEGLFGSQVD